MSITLLSDTREMRRIQLLLDRLDPTASVCTVPGCVHQHDHDVTEHKPPALAAA